MWQLQTLDFTRSIFTSRGDVLRRNFSADIKCSRKTLLSWFASTALCISLPYSSRSQSIIPSQSPRSTKLHVTWCSTFFFSYVRTPQLSLPSTLLPSLLNFLLNFLFFSTAVHLSYRRVVLASLQGIAAAAGRFSCACLQFGQPTVKGTLPAFT